MPVLKTLTEIPGPFRVISQALGTAFKKPGSALIPSGFSIPSVTVDKKQLDAFCSLFGFDNRRVPLTYWHVRLFGVRVLLASEKAFPFPLPGMVHLYDIIEQYETIFPEDELRAECQIGKLLSHEKGTAFETLTRLYKEDRLVWQETTVNLHIGKTVSGLEEVMSRPVEITQPDTTEIWQLPGNMGRRYAQISGDYNPIHIHRAGAALLGFPRQLLHGWYGVNRSISPYQEMLYGKSRMYAAFKKPLFIPAKAESRTQKGEDTVRFEVIHPEEGYPHVKGLLEALK